LGRIDSPLNSSKNGLGILAKWQRRAIVEDRHFSRGELFSNATIGASGTNANLSATLNVVPEPSLLAWLGLFFFCRRSRRAA
jgi:hypothetical protein